MRAKERFLSGIFVVLVAQFTLSSASSHVRQYGGIASRNHHHDLYHKRHSHIAARALAASGGGPSSAPINPNAESSPDQLTNNPAGNSGDSPANNVLGLLDDLYGESVGTGPSDAWRDLGEGNAANEQPNANTGPAGGNMVQPAQLGETVTVFDTEVVWVSATVNGNIVAAPSVSPPAPSPPPAAAAAVNPPVNPPANPVPPVQAAPPPTVAKPQPTPQPLANIIQVGTVPKPQPTQTEPAGSPDQGSPVNTDGMPTTFVDNLDCDSPIYQGLSKLHHDIHRTNHSLSPLAWNDTLYGYAKETAQTCVYGHSLVAGGGGYGQNIAAGDAPGNISAVLTNMFYNAEIGLFSQAIDHQWGTNQPDMSDFEKWGHATQMLWKTTTSFACYTATCSPSGADPLDCAPDGTSYLKNVGCGNGGTKAYNTVCNYYPPGNYAGEYDAVPAPQGSVGFVQMTSNGVVGL